MAYLRAVSPTATSSAPGAIPSILPKQALGINPFAANAIPPRDGGIPTQPRQPDRRNPPGAGLPYFPTPPNPPRQGGVPTQPRPPGYIGIPEIPLPDQTEPNPPHQGSPQPTVPIVERDPWKWIIGGKPTGPLVTNNYLGPSRGHQAAPPPGPPPAPPTPTPPIVIPPGGPPPPPSPVLPPRQPIGPGEGTHIPPGVGVVDNHLSNSASANPLQAALASLMIPGGGYSGVDLSRLMPGAQMPGSQGDASSALQAILASLARY